MPAFRSTHADIWLRSLKTRRSYQNWISIEIIKSGSRYFFWKICDCFIVFMGERTKHVSVKNCFYFKPLNLHHWVEFKSNNSIFLICSCPKLSFLHAHVWWNAVTTSQLTCQHGNLPFIKNNILLSSGVALWPLSLSIISTLP